MSIVLAEEISHVGFVVTDLAAAEAFITDFGMELAGRSGDRFYARGTGPAPFSYYAEVGEAARFGALGIRVASREDLSRLAAHDGVPVEPFDGPGGGLVARLATPDGFTVEVMAEQVMREPDKLEVFPVNQAGQYPRVSQLRQSRKGPSRVMRLGHGVFAISDLAVTQAWFQERFGMLVSDEIRAEAGAPIGAFLRWDRGADPVDHHSIFLMQRSPPNFHHAAFEVHDIDDLMRGHDYLHSKGYKHHNGVGRHHLGGQIFDYWFDPFGFQLEHWTDGDCLVRADASNVVGISELTQLGWGEAPPKMG